METENQPGKKKNKRKGKKGKNKEAEPATESDLLGMEEVPLEIQAPE